MCEIMPFSEFTSKIIPKARMDYDAMTSAPFVWTSPWMSPSISETFRGLGGLRFEVWGSHVKFNFNRECTSLTITTSMSGPLAGMSQTLSFSSLWEGHRQQ